MNRRLAAALAAFSLVASSALAQSPGDSGEIDRSPAMMRPMIERYQADRTTLERSWMEGLSSFGGGRGGGAVPISPRQFARMKKFHSDWQKTLGATNFDSLDQTGKIDYLLLSNQLRYELRQLGLREVGHQTTRPHPAAQGAADLIGGEKVNHLNVPKRMLILKLC